MESVFRPAILLLAGRSLGFAAAFAMPVFLARVFTVQEFGTYKQVFLVYATLFAIAQMGMAESLYYFMPANPSRSGQYAANTLAVLGVCGIACLLLVCLAQNPIGSLFNNPVLPRELPLAGTYLAFSLAAIMLEITMTAHKRFRAAAGTYAVSEILRVGFFLVPVAIFGGLEALLWGAVAFASVRFGTTVVYLREYFGSALRPGWRALGEQLAYALPFAMAVTVEVAQGSLHLYAVAHYFSPTLFAVYAVGCLQIPFVDLMMTSTSNVMMVRMQELRSSGRGEELITVWLDTIVKLSLVFLPMAAALLIVSDRLITVLYTSRYAGSVPVFMVGISAIVLTGIMTDSVLRVFAQTRYLVALNLIRLAVVAGTILFLMRAIGITGAIVATVLATLVFKVLGLMRIKRLLNCSLGQLLPWKALVRIVVITGAAVLPALLLRFTLARSGVNAIIVLVGTSAAFGAAYLLLFYLYAPLSRTEKAALTRWAYRPLVHMFGGERMARLFLMGKRP